MNKYRFLFTLYGKQFIDCITCESFIRADSHEEAREKFDRAINNHEIRIIQFELVREE
jgi:hypothetical protein